jgi:hypothetical protein
LGYSIQGFFSSFLVVGFQGMFYGSVISWQWREPCRYLQLLKRKVIEEWLGSLGIDLGIARRG